jgi:hypothetical protein
MSTETSSFVSLSSWRSDRIFKSNVAISGLIIDWLLLEYALGDLTDMSQLLDGFSVDSSSSKQEKSSFGMMIGTCPPLNQRMVCHINVTRL